MINFNQIEKSIKLSCKTQNNKSTRLDKFLLDNFHEYSRAYFQKLINNKLILVNSKINKKSSYQVKKNDIIQINFPEEKEFDLSPKKIDFEVVDIQKDFIIINKPSGLIVHPSQKSNNNNEEITLVNGLLYKFKELNKFDNKERPGIVHRLDKGTSGLMIIARNTISLIKLSELFKKRLIKKTYLAVAKGLPQKKGIIDYPIGRHPVKRHLMSHVGHYKCKTAITNYEVIKYYKKCSLVSVTIITGRTHQIRVHFAAIGHGLLGDDMYGYISKFIQRPALHAHKLEFEFNSQKFNYSQNPPQDFEDLLTQVNKK
ncbi:RluA family pseudouridine synthase [Candidatus Babeliales bacterium]|nr:RluA family pseudouridine synthase [Candidatus Babeliales bacterium]